MVKNIPPSPKTSILGFFGSYRFLSNYHLRKFELDELIYPSSEHAYMAQKCSGFKMRAYIAGLPLPLDARNFGQELQLPCNWDLKRIPAMRLVLRAKFKASEMQEILLATGDKYLEETNDLGDVFWGVCDAIGENNMGKLLMELRQSLRDLRAPQLT